MKVEVEFPTLSTGEPVALFRTSSAREFCPVLSVSHAEQRITPGREPKSRPQSGHLVRVLAMVYLMRDAVNSRA